MKIKMLLYTGLAGFFSLFSIASQGSKSITEQERYKIAEGCIEKDFPLDCLAAASQKLSLEQVITLYLETGLLAIKYEQFSWVTPLQLEVASLHSDYETSRILADPKNNKVKDLALFYPGVDLRPNSLARINMQLDMAEKFHDKKMYGAMFDIARNLAWYAKLTDPDDLSQDVLYCRAFTLMNYVTYHLFKGGVPYNDADYKRLNIDSFFSRIKSAEDYQCNPILFAESLFRKEDRAEKKENFRSMPHGFKRS